MKKTLLFIISTFMMLIFLGTVDASAIKAPSVNDMANSPDATRSKFCGLAYELLKEREKTKKLAVKKSFTDTDDEKICALAELGIIEGRGEGIFDPDGLITREESAKILCKLMDCIGVGDINVVDERFKDISEVSDWAKEYVDKVGRNEIMEGNGDGFDFNEPKSGISVPKDNFHLYNSDFAPQANYTVWQTQMTLYRLSSRLPKEAEEEKITGLGDNVTLYDNAYSTYAMKDGKVIFCAPHEYYLLSKTKEGHPLLGYKDGVYDLSTGKRLMKLRGNITGMNKVFLTIKLIKKSADMPVEKWFFYYDYNGNYINKRYDKPEEYEIRIDTEGEKHYIFKNEEGKSLTGVYETTPIVSGKTDIGKNIDNSNCFVCTEEKNGNTLYQVYDFDGRLLYEDIWKAFALGSNHYAVMRAPFLLTVYSSVSNEEIVTVEEYNIDTVNENYMILEAIDERSKKYIFNDYSSNLDITGDRYKIDIKLMENETYERYLLIYNDGRTQIRDNDTMELLQEVEGEAYFGDSWEDMQFFYIKKADGTLLVCDRDFNDLLNVGKRYIYHSEGSLYHDEGAAKMALVATPEYNKEDTEHLGTIIYNTEDLGIMHQFYEEGWSVKCFSKNYLVAVHDKKFRLYRAGDQKEYVQIEEEGEIYWIDETDGIAKVYFRDSSKSWNNEKWVEFYDQSLKKIEKEDSET